MPEDIQLQKGKTALLIAPYYDAVTELGGIVERSLIPILQGEGMTVLTLEGDECTYDNLYQILADPLKHGYQLANLIVYIGHGLDDAWLGQVPEQRPMLTPDDVWLLKDAVVVSISCNTLKYLGNLAVTKGGAKAYIGFTDLVLAPVTTEQITNRNYKADFVRTLMQPVVTLVYGRSVKDTVLEFQDLCNYYANLYAEKKYDLWDFHAFCMLHNADSISYAGDPRTVL
jgi:hypothetical protein